MGKSVFQQIRSSAYTSSVADSIKKLVNKYNSTPAESRFPADFKFEFTLWGTPKSKQIAVKPYCNGYWRKEFDGIWLGGNNTKPLKPNIMEENPEKEELRKIVESLKELLPPIIEKVNDFAALPNRTPDEEKEFRELIALVTQSLPMIRKLKEYFGNEIYKQATAYYYKVKEEAAKGDQHSQEILNELTPLYHQSLFDPLNNN
jgi:hypothetical protein